MKYLRGLLSVLVLSLCCALSSAQTSSTEVPTVVPQLVNYAGKAVDAQGKPVSGIAGITFSIYKDQYEGAPLWMETQNVTADAEGNYAVQLGATKPQGLPLDLFSSGEARWLGVRISGGEEQPRVLLLSVPYALKAADAQTLGGLPASAFALATPARGGSVAEVSVASSPAAGVEPALAGTGATDYVPLWTPNGTTLGNSVLFQSGTGSTAKIGINTATPASALDVNGPATVRGNLSLPATGTATSTGGKTSQPTSLTASAYNSSTKAALAQNFRWQAEPAGNNTSSPSGTLNLLSGSGSSTPTETGLHIASNGQITFAKGQTFPGAGGGTITGVTAGTDLTGGGTSGNVTLNLNTGALNSTYAQLSATNTFTANQTMNGNLSVAGSVSAGPISAVASNGNAAVAGNDQSSGGSVGVQGNSTNGTALFGNSTNGIGAYGQSGSSYGVFGVSNSTGVYGVASSSLGSNYGVAGSAYVGVYGTGSIGVSGESNSGVGVSGYGGGTGVYAVGGNSGTGVYGVSNVGVEGYGSSTNSTDYGIIGNVDHGYAGWFNGGVEVQGGLYVSGQKDFKIDHPVDPANKYLFHSSVESSEMMNIYTGTVTSDAEGVATVQLPDWFEALNRDFRYQLTVIGQFAQAIIAQEIERHQFQIKTSLPNVKVSWQVTGVRQDAYAKAHPLEVEQDKAENERGFYLHPELFGAPEEKGILWANAPQAMKRWKEARAKAAAHSPENPNPEATPELFGAPPAKSIPLAGQPMIPKLRNNRQPN